MTHFDEEAALDLLERGIRLAQDNPGEVVRVEFTRLKSQCTYRCVVLPDPCPRERWYDATSRARSATGPGSTPPDRPAPGPE